MGEPLDTCRRVQHVPGAAPAARHVVAGLFVQHEAVAAQPADVAGHGGLVQPQVRRDPADAGLGHQTPAVVDACVHGDVFQDHPRGRTDRPLHLSAGGEHLGERFGAADDAPVGQHPADLPTERDHIPRPQPRGRLGRRRRRRIATYDGGSVAGVGWRCRVDPHVGRRDAASISGECASGRGARVDERRGGVDTRRSPWSAEEQRRHHEDRRWHCPCTSACTSAEPDLAAAGELAESLQLRWHHPPDPQIGGGRTCTALALGARVWGRRWRPCKVLATPLAARA